jgi:formylglycine-generating enzyme required for sulfatase activity
LDAVLSGTPNSWGLYNYAGNAQEWVRTGGSVAAKGGAYTDNMSQCSPATSRPHSGGADAITGFRVLREIK